METTRYDQVLVGRLLLYGGSGSPAACVNVSGQKQNSGGPVASTEAKALEEWIVDLENLSPASHSQGGMGRIWSNVRVPIIHNDIHREHRLDGEHWGIRSLIMTSTTSIDSEGSVWGSEDDIFHFTLKSLRIPTVFLR